MKVPVDCRDNSDPGSGYVINSMFAQFIFHLRIGKSALNKINNRILGIIHLPLIETNLSFRPEVILRLIDSALPEHLTQNIAGTHFRPHLRFSHLLFILFDKRVIEIWFLDAAGDKGAFKKIKLLHGLIKKVPGRNPESSAVAADIELIHIKFKNFLFGIVIFKTQRVKKFFQF